MDVLIRPFHRPGAREVPHRPQLVTEDGSGERFNVGDRIVQATPEDLDGKGGQRVGHPVVVGEGVCGGDVCLALPAVPADGVRGVGKRCPVEEPPVRPVAPGFARRDNRALLERPAQLCGMSPGLLNLVQLVSWTARVRIDQPETVRAQESCRPRRGLCVRGGCHGGRVGAEDLAVSRHQGLEVVLRRIEHTERTGDVGFSRCRLDLVVKILHEIQERLPRHWSLRLFTRFRLSAAGST